MSDYLRNFVMTEVSRNRSRMAKKEAAVNEISRSLIAGGTTPSEACAAANRITGAILEAAEEFTR